MHSSVRHDNHIEEDNTSDGHKAYLAAVEGAFGAEVDFAQLVKIYGEAPHPPVSWP